MLDYGDMVFAWSPDKKDSYLLRLTKGAVQGSRIGQIKHDDFVGREYGEAVCTHLGNALLALRPTLGEYQRRVKRQTQIVFPKETGFILMHMNIGPGSSVVECGTGSGALCCAFAHFVGDTGHVYSYDRREEFSAIAEANAQRWNVRDRITFKVRDVRDDGFDERGADAVFLDMPTPWDLMDAATEALAHGSRLGVLVPTVNQISQTLECMNERNYADIQVVELMLRYYKTDYARMRPEDMMIGHTGYLIFGSRTQGWTAPSLRRTKKSAESSAESATGDGDSPPVE